MAFSIGRVAKAMHHVNPVRHNPLWGKGKKMPKLRRPPRLSFSGLGAVDWGSIIGGAAAAYTGNKPVMGPPAPTGGTVINMPSVPAGYSPVGKPWFQNPIVIGGAAVAVLGLGYLLVRGRRGR